MGITAKKEEKKHLLSHEETLDLIQKVQNGDEEAKALLISSNLGLVRSVIGKFSNIGYERDDLFQLGSIGLIKAIYKFDPSYNVKFSTYAVPMIEGEIRRYLRDNSLLRVSRQIKDLSYQVLKEKEINVNEYGHIPSVEELANKFNVEQKKIIEALDANMPISSLTETLHGDDEDLTLIEIVPDIDNSNEKTLTKISLYQGLDKLPKLEKEIIIKRYYEDKSQVEIAKLYNISQAQVSRLEKNAINFLRKFV